MAIRPACVVRRGCGLPGEAVPAFCRDCLVEVDDSRCASCDGTRVASHPELFDLTIAHIDCDAFYASVEKRDRPELAAQPVIVGGGVRGVVTAACYVARLYGVRSAMPMFKALKACPDAVVIRPDFTKYVAVGRQIRGMMAKLTPLLQPLSIDEAALDLAGTERCTVRRPPSCWPASPTTWRRPSGSPYRSDSLPIGCWRKSRPAATSRAASR
jgi:DNA polymerase-4